MTSRPWHKMRLYHLGTKSRIDDTPNSNTTIQEITTGHVHTGASAAQNYISTILLIYLLLSCTSANLHVDRLACPLSRTLTMRTGFLPVNVLHSSINQSTL